MRKVISAGLIALACAACSGRQADPIRDFGTATVTEVERDVVIHKELALPPTFNVLPTPTPGGANRADP